MRIRTAAVATGVLAVTALGAAGPAGAHSLRLSRATGDPMDTFVYRGRGWQPGGRIFGALYARETDRRPLRTFPGRVKRDGTFVFHTTPRVRLVDEGFARRMCFTQFDSRPFVRRTFRRCESFYVNPPQVRFEPSSGSPGERLMLVITGFLARERLTIELRMPDARTKLFRITTRSSGAFLSGGPTGRVYAPAGGAATLLRTAAEDPPGLYEVAVYPSGTSSRRSARTAVLLS